MEFGKSQREICAHFNEGNMAQFGRSAKMFRIVELLLSYEVVLFCQWYFDWLD